MLNKYHAVVQEQLNTGIVERVKESGLGEAGEVHHLAHHQWFVKTNKRLKLEWLMMRQLNKVETCRLIQVSQNCTHRGYRKGIR